ncbi:MAG: uroporphyrinogen-III C-methyltransferase, partial [bacterium]|nr:uroporphyrinogen-III C-methyltransferase [bacterium]
VGLITIKALNLLKNADVVLYDALVNKDLLLYAKKALHIFTGKVKGTHFATQDKINRLMLKYFSMGKCVVRLKGGDPFIFGRGADEVIFLKKHRINPEVVPGISSIQATIFAGIPLTYREFTSMLTVVTGHSTEDTLKSVPKVEFEKISSNSTVVVLMGLKNLDYIVKELLKNGFKRSAHCAVLRSITMEDEYFIYGKLGNIVQKVNESNIEPPAIFVVGNVVKLFKFIGVRKRIHLVIFFENEELYKFLIENGYLVSIMPILTCKPIDFDVDIKSYDAIVFTSREGVKSFYKKVKKLSCISILNGPGVMDEFLKHYKTAFVVPNTYDVEGIIEVVKTLNVKRILVVRAYGLADVFDGLRKLGYEVDVISTYKQMFTKVEFIDSDGYVFTSPNIVRKYYEFYGVTKKPVFVIGDKAYKALKDYGFKAYKAKETSYESLLETINGYYRKVL